MRYFLHLRDGTSEILDPEGVEFASIEDLKAAAVLACRDLMRHDIVTGVLDLRYRIEVENAEGEVVYSLPFDKAISIIYPGG